MAPGNPSRITPKKLRFKIDVVVLKGGTVEECDIRMRDMTSRVSESLGGWVGKRQFDYAKHVITSKISDAMSR